LQVPPTELQLLMPEGELDTRSDAGPLTETWRAKVGAGANTAVTVTGAVPIVKMHWPVPLQMPPLQFEKM